MLWAFTTNLLRHFAYPVLVWIFRVTEGGVFYVFGFEKFNYNSVLGLPVVSVCQLGLAETPKDEPLFDEAEIPLFSARLWRHSILTLLRVYRSFPQVFFQHAKTTKVSRAPK